MPKIQEFINNRHKYIIDPTYQRPKGVWSSQDNACLIDTILREEPIPMFFINEKTDKDKYYIVDGQQRLNAIKLFYGNELKLNEKFSGKENHGKTFNDNNPITDEKREIFLNYTLNFHILEDYDDERIRLIFSRLQRGKPLTIGERLNAMPGNIVLAMRTIAKHPLMSKSIGISQERYGAYPDSARVLFYEKYGQKDCGTSAIISFFDENNDLSENSKEFKNAIKVLNFLRRCFPDNDYQFLSKHTWVYSVYTMIREMMISYSLVGKEQIIRRFVESFHSKVYSEDRRRSNQIYQRFYDNVRGGWSEKLVALRRSLLIREFLDKYPIEELDEKRQISEEEKIAAFEKHNHCELCGCEFKDFKGAEYHHKIKHSKGGKSKINNIMVLCKKCHDKIHGQENIELHPENDIEEEENEE